MSDRAIAPIRPRVHWIAVASVVSISAMANGVAWAQQPPVATPQPSSAQPPAEGGTTQLGDSQLSGSRGTLLVKVFYYNETTGDLIPAPNVVVRVESEYERPRYGVTGLKPDGSAAVARLRLYTGRYKVVVTSANYQRDEKDVEVHEAPVTKDGGGAFDEVTFILYTRTEELREKLLFSLLNRNELSNVTHRDRRFFNDFPLGAGNRQSLSKQLRSIPGFVEDTLNQVHPRGDNAVTTATMIDGVLIPQMASGRIAQVFLPDALDSIDARVGGLAPEYGGGSGAVLDMKTRRPSPQGRYLDFALRSGDTDTNDLYLNFGGGLPGPGMAPRRGLFKRFTYDVSLSNRYTSEAAEAPSDAFGNPKNDGASEVVFAKATFDLGKGRTISALGNFASGRSGVANRFGYNSSLINYGAGFGFLGEKNFDGKPSSLIGANSEDGDGQDIRQKDNNSLIMIQARSKDPKGNEAFIALGQATSTLFQGARSGGTSFKTLPRDNGISYLPTTLNDYQQFFFQAEYSTPEPRSDAKRTHRLKIGALYHNLDGLDSYQFIPKSVLALDELFALDPRLAPPIGQLKQSGVDERGNLQFTPLSKNLTYPVLFAARTGDYSAAYVQDTYKISNLFRMNFGLRLDAFNQKTNITTTNPDFAGITDVRDASTSTISPRLNVAYVSRYGPRLGGFFRPVDVILKPLGFIFNEQTILRASFNRLVAPPETGQGYFLANQRDFRTGKNVTTSDLATFAPTTQITDQYDLSIERQIGDFSVLKVGVYSKDIKNALTTRSVLTGLQAGMVSTVNQGRGIADGFEVSFETNRPLKRGARLHSFLSFANSASKPVDPFQYTNLAGGVATATNNSELVRSTYYQYDQTNTISTGLSYRFVDGSSLGLSAIYGSGLYSSILTPLPSPVTADIVNSGANRNNQVRIGGREAFNEVNIRFATRPDFIYRSRDGRGVGLEMSIENLLDSVTRLNWRGPIGGNRYQLGRRVFVAVTGRL